MFNGSRFDQMPGNSFTLTIRVGSQINFGGSLRQLLQFFDDCLFLVRDAVLRRKVVLHVHG